MYNDTGETQCPKGYRETGSRSKPVARKKTTLVDLTRLTGNRQNRNKYPGNHVENG
jgi:hypothetical protein